MRKYQAIQDGDRYTIGEFDESYQAFIINDGICNYYFWDTREEAEAAAEAYNTYEGLEWLGEHGYGNDSIPARELDRTPREMVELYKLFNAIDYEEPEDDEDKTH